MTRRTPAQYDWAKVEFDETILADIDGYPRRQMSRDGQKIQFIVIHHMGMVGDGDGDANDACIRTWRERPASAHYGVDGKNIRQFVWDSMAAWGAGDLTANKRSISIEHANSTGKPSWKISDDTLKTGARLVAHLCHVYKLGRPEWGKTMRPHRDFTSTACPGPYLNGSDAYEAEAQRVYDSLQGTPAPTPEPDPEPPASKVYIVQRGDTLSAIARKFRTTVAQLQKWNDIDDPNRIEVGQRLKVAEGTTPTPAKLPAQLIDLRRSKLTTPFGKKDHPTEVKQPGLNKYADGRCFFVRENVAGRRAVVFRVTGDGVTTENSSYPRCELREMEDGDEADWSTRDHERRLLEGLYHVSGNAKVVVQQIHDDDDDVVMVSWNPGGRIVVEWSKGPGNGSDKNEVDIVGKDEWFHLAITAGDGVIKVLLNGEEVAKRKTVRSGCYQKTAAYLQSSKSSAWAEVAIAEDSLKMGKAA